MSSTTTVVLPVVALGAGGALSLWQRTFFYLIVAALVTAFVLLFTTAVGATPLTVSLSGSDVSNVTWVGATPTPGFGVYSFYVSKNSGLAIWLSTSPDTTQPAIVILVDTGNQTAIYRWDGKQLGSPVATAQQNFPLVYYRDAPSAKAPWPILQVWVAGGTVSLFGANAAAVLANEWQTHNLITVNQLGTFLAQYTETTVAQGSCWSSLGFASTVASAANEAGSIADGQWITSGFDNFVSMRMSNSDALGTVNAWNAAWKFPKPNESTIQFDTFFQPDPDDELSQNGIVVWAGNTPDYNAPDNVIYQFQFWNKYHVTTQPLKDTKDAWSFAISARTVIDGATDSENYCGGVVTSSQSEGEVYPGFSTSSCDVGVCFDAIASSQCSECLVFDTALSSDNCGSDAAGTVAPPSPNYGEWPDTFNNFLSASVDSNVTLWASVSASSLQMGFIDSNGSPLQLFSTPLDQPPALPLNYWGFSLRRDKTTSRPHVQMILQNIAVA